MSQLIDKLNQIAKAVPQPIGFRPSQSVSAKPKVLLIASLIQATSINNLTDYITGADTVLLPITKLSGGTKTIQKIAQSVPDILWGGWLETIDRRRIASMVKAGCDFIVFPTSTALAIPHDGDKIGKILQVEASLSEGLLKAINELPVSAVLIAGKSGAEQSLTWRHLMLFQHFTGILTKPLLVSIPINVTAKELQALWETGVGGVVVEVGGRQSAGRLEELRQAVDKLTFPPRRREKAEALLPRIGEETVVTTETEEEEEDL